MTEVSGIRLSSSLIILVSLCRLRHELAAVLRSPQDVTIILLLGHTRRTPTRTYQREATAPCSDIQSGVRFPRG
ncbi:hypothetical protein FB45DRAFT_222808 [Roridomyces roridus]|uniref:Secreted protein n=1 Tax=Roridomyces roridus TaxID=1738132 RepID=A0AAD7FFD3_9AGAR|nr:hypothetical protein FB45DRAFT_222808 [Roridomyces roridus]